MGERLNQVVFGMHNYLAPMRLQVANGSSA